MNVGVRCEDVKPIAAASVGADQIACIGGALQTVEHFMCSFARMICSGN